jgi:hypothetical protein
VELNAVSLVHTVFSYCPLFRCSSRMCR